MSAIPTLLRVLSSSSRSRTPNFLQALPADVAPRLARLSFAAPPLSRQLVDDFFFLLRFTYSLFSQTCNTCMRVEITKVGVGVATDKRHRCRCPTKRRKKKCLADNNKQMMQAIVVPYLHYTSFCRIGTRALKTIYNDFSGATMALKNDHKYAWISYLSTKRPRLDMSITMGAMALSIPTQNASLYEYML